MTIIAKCPVELDGHIYHKGEKCAYEGDITPRLADNFTDESGQPLATNKGAARQQDIPSAESIEQSKNRKIDKCISVMGRDGIKRALDAMNITYSPNANTEYLTKLLLISRGEIES